jgi:hypothetical protein
MCGVEPHNDCFSYDQTKTIVTMNCYMYNQKTSTVDLCLILLLLP